MIDTATLTPTPPPVRPSTADPAVRNDATAGCGGCSTRWPIGAGAVAHCPRCHLTFASVGGFDAHRTGPIDRRRCLEETELHDLGYAPNDLGRWRVPIDPVDAARLTRSRTR